MLDDLADGKLMLIWMSSGATTRAKDTCESFVVLCDRQIYMLRLLKL